MKTSIAAAALADLKSTILANISASKYAEILRAAYGLKGRETMEPAVLDECTAALKAFWSENAVKLSAENQRQIKSRLKNGKAKPAKKNENNETGEGEGEGKGENNETGSDENPVDVWFARAKGRSAKARAAFAALEKLIAQYPL